MYTRVRLLYNYIYIEIRNIISLFILHVQTRTEMYTYVFMYNIFWHSIQLGFIYKEKGRKNFLHILVHIVCR